MARTGGADGGGWRLQILRAAKDIKATIFGHAQFTAFNAGLTDLLARWQTANTPQLEALGEDTRPKELIESLAETLLTSFEHARLLDPYDIYQHLMDYWAEPMQDDVYLIASEGWELAAKPRRLLEEKGSKNKEKADYVVGKVKYKTELIPVALIVAKYFAKDQLAVEALEAEVAAVGQSLEEMAEEHGGEDGLLADAKNDKEKLTKASVAARLSDISRDLDAAEERKVLKEYQTLIDKEAALGSQVKLAQDRLMATVAAQYGKLNEFDIKSLVIHDKWLTTIAVAVQGELDRVSQTLTGRVRELAERYATPLPKMMEEVAELERKVAGHLATMGFSL